MKKSTRAALGACIALFANMGINSVFTIYLFKLIAEWPDAPVTKIALAATLGCAMAFVCSTFVVGPLLKKLSPRALFLGCAVFALAYCLFYAFSTGVTMIIIAGLFGGIILSIGTHAMGVAAITPYFADYGKKASSVIGVVLASAALGAAAFSFIPGILMNTADNIRMNGNDIITNTFGADFASWRISFLGIAVIVVVCNIIAFVLIPAAKKENGISAQGTENAGDIPGLTMGQTLKTPSFWFVFIGILFLTIMYQGLCTYMPTFLKVCGLAEESANSMQGIMQLVGIVFILAGGVLVNKIGVKGLILFSAVPLAAGCLIYAYVFPANAVFPLAVICSVLCVTGGVITNICSAITPVLFGVKSMSQINSIYSGGAFWGGAALASQVIGHFITDAANSACYSKGFTVAAVIGIVGMVFLFLAIAMNPMKKSEIK